MPKNRCQLIRCVACGKPLLKCCLDNNDNLQKIKVSMEEFTYDEIYDIYLCDECYIPEQVVEQIS